MTAARLLEGQSAIVSGDGAGMGAAITRRLLSEGAVVFAVDRDPEALETLILSQPGDSNLRLVTADVSSAEDVGALADQIGAGGAKLDILINNAGIFPSVAFEDLSVEDWNQVLAVNLTGAFLMTRALLPFLKKSDQGRIINIGSSSIFSGTPNAAHYVASKAGLVGLTRSLAPEVGKYGVTANVVTPGLTLTEGIVKKAPSALIEARRGQRAIARDQQAEDIVGAVVFLAGKDSAFMTGQILNVDGGIAKH